MAEWEVHRVGDVAEVFDGPHATPKKTQSGPWFLSISSLKRGRLDLEASAHVSEQDFIKWTRRVTPEAGDVLFSYETRLGEAALMPANVRACLGRRMGLLRPKRDRVLPRFLMLAFLAPEFQTTIQSRRIHGATVDRIPLAELPKWHIRLPGLTEQRAVSEVLGALDDKIAVNERIAMTAYDAMRAHYMGALERQSPVTRSLGELAQFHNKQRVPLSSRQRAEFSGQYPYYGAAGVVDYVKDFVFSGPHVLVGEDGSVITEDRKPVTQYVWGDFWVNNHAHVLTGKEITTELMSVALWFTDVSSLVTGAVQPKLNMRNLRKLEVPLPGERKRAAVERLVGNLSEIVRQRTEESGTLAALRDTLLPQLMSGKLRVRDAERIVEDAV